MYLDTKSCSGAKTRRVEVVWEMFGCSGDTYVWHAVPPTVTPEPATEPELNIQRRERSKIASLETSILKKSREFKSLRLTSLEAS